MEIGLTGAAGTTGSTGTTGNSGELTQAIFLYLAAVAVALAIAPRTLLYWDSFGYVTQAITGGVGGLGLGRPIFAFVNRALAGAWLGLGGSPWHVEALIRVWIVAVSCLAAPLTRMLAHDIGVGARPAFLAALAVACSPAFAHAGGTVLTDGPAATLFVAASVAGVRCVTRGGTDRHAVLSGVFAGLAVGVREQSVLNAAVLVLLAWAAPQSRRLRVAGLMAFAFLVVVAVPVVVAAITDPGYAETVRAWLAGMRHDRALKTFGFSDAVTFGRWLFALGPVVVVAAGIAFITERSFLWRPRGTPFALIAPSLAQTLATAAFLGIAYSPRFLLTPFPVAFAIPAAMAFDRWVGASRVRVACVVAATAVPALIAAPIVRQASAPREAIVRDWPARLASVPRDSVIVSGTPCAAIPLVAAMRARAALSSGIAPPAWDAVCPGWAWPTDVTAHLDAARATGRTVVLDTRPAAWTGAEQHAALAEIRSYVERHQSVAGETPLVVWR